MMARYNINDSENKRREGLKEILKAMDPELLYNSLMMRFETSREKLAMVGSKQDEIHARKYKNDAIWVKSRFMKKPKSGMDIFIPI